MNIICRYTALDIFNVMDYFDIYRRVFWIPHFEGITLTGVSGTTIPETLIMPLSFLA